MKVIVVEEGVRTDLELERAVISIGRAIDNDIRISSSLVSRRHCRIETGPDGVWAIDLGSSNGTLLNGQKIKRSLLNPGDTLRVGKATIQIESDEPRGGDTQQIEGWQAAEAALGELGTQTLTGEAQRERENLRVFARLTRELLRETDLGKLLRSIVDGAISLAGAERGFLLLDESLPAVLDGSALAIGDERGERAPLKVRVARSFDREDIPIPSSRLSSGIASKVIESRQPLVSVDAERDPRFSGMASVEDLKLRSVMCVPLFVSNDKGSRVEGVLYVDNRLQQAAFQSDDLELMKLLGDQAALAIRNARQLSELRERNEKLTASARKIELLNEQLGRKVRDRDTELAVVRAELGRERGRYDYTAIVGASEGMRRVFHQLDRIIESELPVMIQGDSGTGKELIARAIHFNGPRKHKGFVSENCAALPDTLLESELFGHTRGAFTGAHRAKKGLLEQADGGTLFLDEIGDMSVEMQKKLLRVLQEGEVRAVGSEERVKVNVRIIAASHRNLEALVKEGKFREDLFYRVNVLKVDLPPLRERREDIPLLAEALLARAAREANRPVPVLPREVLAALVAHDWPGNVRELENEMRRLVVLAGGEVRLEHLSQSVLERRSLTSASSSAGLAVESGSIRDAVADLEKRSIEAALASCNGNKSRAAKLLGISRFALQRKLDKYGLGSEGDEPDLSDAGEPLDD
ncbi:MAG: sigma 54-interacting transcriptional regulator [Planctomycetes bacterium]|nr:sigma 54-interacting transcriptional regulator [Planctomycetota bacterium]